MRSFLLCGRFQTTFMRPLTPSLKQDMHNVSWYCPKCPKYSTFDPRFRHFHQDSCLKWKYFFVWTSMYELPSKSLPEHSLLSLLWQFCSSKDISWIKTSRTHEVNLFNFFFAHSNNEPLYMKTLVAQAFTYVDSQVVGTWKPFSSRNVHFDPILLVSFWTCFSFLLQKMISRNSPFTSSDHSSQLYTPSWVMAM